MVGKSGLKTTQETEKCADHRHTETNDRLNTQQHPDKEIQSESLVVTTRGF